MKRYYLLLLLFSLLLQPAFAHWKGGMMWRNLPSQLNLTPQQKSHFDVYFSDMHKAMKEDHEKAVAKLQMMLTSDQFQKLSANLKKHHMMKTDDDVEAVVNEESTRLLLTTNQMAEFNLISLTLFHQERQLVTYFFARLNKVLNKEQQRVLSSLNPYK